MAIEHSARLEGGLLVVKASGFDENIEQVREYGLWIIDEALRLDVTHILCDERDLEYRLSTLDTFAIASYIAEAAPRMAKIALACNPRFMADAVFWENVAVNRGLIVKVFKDIDDARAWLTDAAN